MYTTNVIAGDSSLKRKCTSASSAWKVSADFASKRKLTISIANSAQMCWQSQRHNLKSTNARDYCNAQYAYQCWPWWWLSQKGTTPTGQSSSTTIACIASGIPCTLILRERIWTRCSSSSIITKASILDLHSKSCTKSFLRFTSTTKTSILRKKSLF